MTWSCVKRGFRLHVENGFVRVWCRGMYIWSSACFLADNSKVLCHLQGRICLFVYAWCLRAPGCPQDGGCLCFEDCSFSLTPLLLGKRGGWKWSWLPMTNDTMCLYTESSIKPQRPGFESYSRAKHVTFVERTWRLCAFPIPALWISFIYNTVYSRIGDLSDS